MRRDPEEALLLVANLLAGRVAGRRGVRAAAEIRDAEIAGDENRRAAERMHVRTSWTGLLAFVALRSLQLLMNRTHLFL